MKSTKNFLSYEGIVNLKLIDEKTKRVRKSLILHNKGTNNLFYFLCGCLTHNSNLNSYSPAAIDVGGTEYNEEESAAWESSLAYRVLLSNKSLVQNVKSNYGGEEVTFPYAARFSAIIPYSAFLGVTAEVKCIQLHSSAASTDKIGSLLAYLNLTGEDAIKLDEGNALLIEWNMGFLNPDQNPYHKDTTSTPTD